MKEFSVFEPVLTRINNTDVWSADFYDRPHISGEGHWTITGGFIEDTDILPYNEKTKHLHNNVGEFVEWEPKKGEPILVKEAINEDWVLRIFLGMKNNRYVCTSYPEANYHGKTTIWDQAKPYVNPFKE